MWLCEVTRVNIEIFLNKGLYYITPLNSRARARARAPVCVYSNEGWKFVRDLCDFCGIKCIVNVDGGHVSD